MTAGDLDQVGVDVAGQPGGCLVEEVVGTAGVTASGGGSGHDRPLGARDRLDDASHHLGRDRDLDLHLGQEAHRVFGPAVDLGVPLLTAVAFDLGHGQTMDA